MATPGYFSPASFSRASAPPAGSLTPQIPYKKERDVYEQWLNERDRAANRGDAFDQEVRGDLDYNRQIGRGYDNLVPDLYQGIWAGGGGFTPEMQQEIMDREGLDKLGWDPSMGEANMLRPDEIASISGNPYAAFDNFRGQQSKVESWMTDANQNERGAVDRLRTGYDLAIDPSALRTSSSYAPGQRSILGGGASRIRSVVDSPDLGISDEYRTKAGMSDEEVDQMAQARAQEVGGIYQGEVDRLESQARQAGMTNPLAVAELRGQRLRQSAAAQSDALNRGELEARAAQREAVGNVEKTRLGARQYQSGLQYDAEGNLLSTGLDVERDIEDRRQGSERDISDRRIRAAEGIGSADISTEGRIGDRGIGIGQWGADRAAGLIQSGEGEASRRAGDISGNRQSNTRANQQDQYTRDAGVTDRRSGRALNTYAPWLQVQSEGRQAAGQLSQDFATRQNTNRQQQLEGWGLSQQGTQGATAGYAGWGDAQNQVGFGSNFSRAAGGTFGQMVGSGFSNYKAPKK
jgi:hypothetical protein